MRLIAHIRSIIGDRFRGGPPMAFAALLLCMILLLAAPVAAVAEDDDPHPPAPCADVPCIDVDDPDGDHCVGPECGPPAECDLLPGGCEPAPSCTGPIDACTDIVPACNAQAACITSVGETDVADSPEAVVGTGATRAPTESSPTAVAGIASSPSGSLPYTGADVGRPLAAAVILLMLGLAMWQVGRTGDGPDHLRPA